MTLDGSRLSEMVALQCGAWTRDRLHCEVRVRGGAGRADGKRGRGPGHAAAQELPTVRTRRTATSIA
jgi:hypothetical protein